MSPATTSASCSPARWARWAVITQLTLKVKPLPERSAFVAGSHARPAPCRVDCLNALVISNRTPAAIELLARPDLEQRPALGDLRESIRRAFTRRRRGRNRGRSRLDDRPRRLTRWRRRVGTCARRDASNVTSKPDRALGSVLPTFRPRTIRRWCSKSAVPPSGVTTMLELVTRGSIPQCSIQAHAGNGVVIARFAEFSRRDVSKVLVGKLRPAAIDSRRQRHGAVVQPISAN